MGCLKRISLWYEMMGEDLGGVTDIGDTSSGLPGFSNVSFI